MTKGQRAMAWAMIYPEPEKGGRGKKSSVTEEFVSSALISNARAVLKHAPDLAAGVLAGASLNDAYKTMREVKQGSGSGGVGRAPEGRCRPPAEQFRVLRVGG